MNVPFFIARRYLFSRKSTHVINIISIIAIVGIMVGTMALVSVLSVFNGLENLILERFNSFNSDLRIEPTTGKTFNYDSTLFVKLEQIGGIKTLLPTVEENVLIKYEEVYHPFKIKGVSDDYETVIDIKPYLVDGDYRINYKNEPLAVMGAAVSGILSFRSPYAGTVQIYVPNRETQINDSPENAFKSKSIIVSGIFTIDPDIDYMMIVPLYFLKDLLNYSNQVTALEVQLTNPQNSEEVEDKIQSILGDDFNVKNRFEQNALLYKILKSEKLIVFLLLAFILLIASFNIVGSLTMLIIEKKQDAITMRSLGLGLSGVKKVFMYQGLIISFLGAVSGILLGLLFCFLQQEFSLIPMDSANPDAFIVNAYPVDVSYLDVLIVFLTVISIGYISSRFPVRYITRKYITNQD